MVFFSPAMCREVPQACVTGTSVQEIDAVALNPSAHPALGDLQTVHMGVSEHDNVPDDVSAPPGTEVGNSYSDYDPGTGVDS